MSDLVASGPRAPSRPIFITTVVVASAVGLVTGDIRAFMLAVVACVVLLCAGYAILRHLLGWRPLTFDDLFYLIRLLAP